jgi:hypothetical protein
MWKYIIILLSSAQLRFNGRAPSAPIPVSPIHFSWWLQLGHFTENVEMLAQPKMIPERWSLPLNLYIRQICDIFTVSLQLWHRENRKSIFKAHFGFDLNASSFSSVGEVAKLTPQKSRFKGGKNVGKFWDGFKTPPCHEWRMLSLWMLHIN